MIAVSSCKTLKIEAAQTGFGAFDLKTLYLKLPICPRALVISFQTLLMAKQV